MTTIPWRRWPNLTESDHLVILTDQAGLYEADPRHHPGARRIDESPVEDPALDAMVGDAGTLGRGGMQTKLRAARLAARSGTDTVIASGREPEVLLHLRGGQPIGTLLTASQAPLAAHKQWLAGHLKLRGKLVLDDGAVKMLKTAGKSLLAVGITDVEGDFRRGEVVSCVDRHGNEIARGLVNYSAAEVMKLRGQPSENIEAILGYVAEPEIIHRDNMVVF